VVEHTEYYEISPVSVADVPQIVELIHRNLSTFEEYGSVIASIFRRTERFIPTYMEVAGSTYYIVKINDQIAGGVGVGPLAGLPREEGIAEIRDLVVDESFRGQGIGRSLLKRAIRFCLQQDYKEIYLETTPQMSVARNLFSVIGFEPVTHTKEAKTRGEEFPYYFKLSLEKFAKTA
jgi:putative acetyltransferase